MSDREGTAEHRRDRKEDIALRVFAFSAVSSSRRRTRRTSRRRRRARRGSPCCRPKIAARRRRAISRSSAPVCTAATRRPSASRVRALGRLERPALIPDILPVAAPRAARRSEPKRRTRSARPRRAGRATRRRPRRRSTPSFAPLAARLKVEAEPDVRAAICETIGRLPYVTAAQVGSGGADAGRDGRPRRDGDRSARRRAGPRSARAHAAQAARARRRSAGAAAPAGDAGEGRSGHRRAGAPPRARGADDGRGGRRGDAGRAPRTIPTRRCGGWRCARRRPRRRRWRPPSSTAS